MNQDQEPRRPRRYDQCDETCTTDCGHCKGAGRGREDAHRIHGRMGELYALPITPPPVRHPHLRSWWHTLKVYFGFASPVEPGKSRWDPR